MKKIIRNLSLCFFVASITFMSCKNADNEKKYPEKKYGAKMTVNKRGISERGILKLTDFTDKQQEIITDFYKTAKSCASDTVIGCEKVKKNCSVDYCQDADCTKKIICCHEIDLATFYALTDTMRTGSAVFPESSVIYVVKDADCYSQYIKLSVSDDRNTYYLESLNDTTSTRVYCKSFYSVALMQGILAKGIKSFEVYEGVAMNGTKLVPFIVHYKSGETRLYDVSNDMP